MNLLGTSFLFDGLPEISKMKYRIPEPGTTISGFADSLKKKKKKKLIATFLPKIFFKFLNILSNIFFSITY
jgi:hypothetical protein